MSPGTWTRSVLEDILKIEGSMKVYKYYVRPCDPASEKAALDEIARYVQARNLLLKLKEKWARIREEMILPEYRERAAELRATPRTGRKPSKVRGDREELRAADNRAAYAEFIAAGGSYATWWLAEAASKKALHPVRDEYAGRAGILPERLEWDGSIARYCGTTWSVHARQLRRLLKKHAIETPSATGQDRDRPVPSGVRIAQAWLQRERVSTALLRKPRYHWFLVLVLDEEQRVRPISTPRTAAGLDIAWRQDADTLRVAYAADDVGEHRPIRMRAQHYERMNHAASLQQLADHDANALRTELGVPHNTSHGRLVKLAPEHPLAKHMVHLLDWQHGARRNALASRDELYLLEVHRLCAAHHTIYVEKMKGVPELVQKRSTRKKKGAPDDVKCGVARGQRQAVAAFAFLRLLQREAGKFGTEVIEVNPAYTSQTCYACDHPMGPADRRERVCDECGRRWDVDHLAALNLLRWGTARKSNDTAAE